jgi:hypothetical protein
MNLKDILSEGNQTQGSIYTCPKQADLVPKGREQTVAAKSCWVGARKTGTMVMDTQFLSGRQQCSMIVVMAV